MPYDVTVILDDKPGELARLGEVAGEAGVNLDGFAAFTGEGKGVVHVLVADDVLRKLCDALSAAQMGIADEREVFVVTVANEPGALGETARQVPLFADEHRDAWKRARQQQRLVAGAREVGLEPASVAHDGHAGIGRCAGVAAAQNRGTMACIGEQACHVSGKRRLPAPADDEVADADDGAREPPYTAR